MSFRSRAVSGVVGALALAGLVLGVTAIAGADRSPFQDFREVVDNMSADASEAGDVPDIVSNPVPAPSLDAVRAADLRPYEWPWFAEGVPVPPDALANGADLVAALGEVPGLAGFKVLAGEHMYADEDGADTGIRSAWLAVGSDEVLRIVTQRLTPTMAIPIGQGIVVTSYGRGEAIIESEPGRVEVIYATSSRMVIMRQLAVGDFDRSVSLSMSSDDLLKLAAELAEVLEGSGS
jgi:hypothetical protein